MQDVPKIVVKRLQETTAAGTHPDADLLTAFTEQSLVESERARVMAHLARCSDCREVVALALPATEVAAVTTSASTSRSAWLLWPVLRWGVVVAGLIAIASVGIVQYRQRQKSETLGSNPRARNETTSTAVQTLPSPPKTPESHSIIVQPENQKQTEKQAEMRRNGLSDRQDDVAAGLVRPLNPNLPASRTTRGAASGIAAGVGFGSAGGVPKPAPPPPRDVSAGAGDLKNATPEEAANLAPSLSGGQAVGVPFSSQAVEVESQTAPVTATTENQLSDQLIENPKEQPSQYRSSKSLGAVAAQDAASVLDTTSLQRGSAKWSISADGALQRSFDAGNTWVYVNVNPEQAASRSKVASTAENTYENNKSKVKAQLNMVFRAVTANGTEVWAGGSSAMLYHSRDSGSHWARVLPSSSGATLTGDITSIEFSDAQHGRIATSTREIWITADAGQTWQRQ